MTFRTEIIGDQTLILGDCREVMPTLGRFDACVTDPPHGIGENHKKVASRGKLAKPIDYGDFDWDNAPADKNIIDAARLITDWQIIFGGNYFELPPTACWLVWDKQNGDNDFADCELAWTNLDKAVRRIYWLWNGMIRKGNEGQRVHPTQKPVGVIRWCLEHLPAGAETILDPFMGSGTTLVACQQLGRKGTGIEISEKYFDIACKRVQQAAAQPRLFAEPMQQPKQEVML